METVGRENMPEGGVSTREAPRRESQSLRAPGVAAETGSPRQGRGLVLRGQQRGCSLGWERGHIPGTGPAPLPGSPAAPTLHSAGSLTCPGPSPQTRQPGRGYSGAHFTDEKTEAQAG